MRLTFKQLTLSGLIFGIFSMAFAAFLQYFLDLPPCPLCIIDRILVCILIILFTVGAMHRPQSLGRKIYASIIMFVSLCGLASTIRHIYLQNLPKDQVPECGPGIDYILQTFPLSEALPMIFQGSGECAEVAWTFLGFSLAQWTAVAFLLFALNAILAFFSKS